jgi:hypothetical protein
MCCSAAMLKKRIKKWSLDRNKKHADMLVALRLALEREAMRKKTVFSIRGRLVTFDDVRHYFRRKGIHDLKSLASDASTSSPTTQIDCHTPEPETPSEIRDTRDPESLPSAEGTSMHHDLGAGNVYPDCSVVALPDPDQVDRTISITSTLGQVEQLLYLGRAYYDAIFEDPTWRSNLNTFNVGALETFYHHVFDGQSLLEENNVNEAFEHFERAFDLVRTLLSNQVLLFLPYLYHLLLPDRRIRRQEVISQLLYFIFRMTTTTCCPRLRPIQHSLSLLGCMSLEDRGESSKRVYQCLLDRVRIHFDSDVQTNGFDMDPNVLCFHARAEPVGRETVDNYKLTSIAVMGLVNDADGQFSRRPGAAASREERCNSKHGGWHCDLKEAKLLRDASKANAVEVLMPSMLISTAH